MDKSGVTIATMTWARDAQEERLLRESLRGLAALNVPAFVTDGGSPERFLDFVRGFAHFSVFQADAPGLWPQVRRSIRAAHDSAASFILYTEPDKRDFFRAGLPEFISEATGGGRAGVVLAARNAGSFATFPEFQRDTEAAINRCCAEVVGAQGDFTYGPFLLNRALVPHLSQAPDDIGWGWRPYAFGVARRLGYRVAFVERDLPCPAEQRDDSRAERVYRMKQLSERVRGLVLSTTVEAARDE